MCTTAACSAPSGAEKRDTHSGLTLRRLGDTGTMPHPSQRRAFLATPPEARFRARWAALLAVAAGLVGLLAFPRFGYWPLAIVSVAMFVVAVDGRRSRTAAWLGYLYGAAFMVPLISW